MAEYELIQDRVVSGKGVLKIPSDGVRSRANILYTDVVREPKNKYLNLEWNPPRSRYANLCFLRKGYVLFHSPVEFEHQVFDGVNEPGGQALIALKCAYEGVLISIANLGTALGETLVQYTDTIKDYESLNNSWDEVRIKCYADTAIQLRLYGLPYDACSLEKDDTRKPIEPPPQFPKVPLGTPVPNDNPYNYLTGDDGSSLPYPGDAPVPSTCTLTGVALQSANSSFREPFSITVPNGSYVSVYADYVSPGVYYARTDGNQGIITISGPFTSGTSNTVSFAEFRNSCNA